MHSIQTPTEIWNLRLFLVPIHRSHISHFFCCDPHSRNLACAHFQRLSQLLFFAVLSALTSALVATGHRIIILYVHYFVFFYEVISFIPAWGWRQTLARDAWVTGILLSCIIWKLPDILRTPEFLNPSVYSFFCILKYVYSSLLLPFLSLSIYLFFNQALGLIFCQCCVQLTDNTLFWSWLNASLLKRTELYQVRFLDKLMQRFIVLMYFFLFSHHTRMS